jgi:hypothetical protein
MSRAVDKGDMFDKFKTFFAAMILAWNFFLILFVRKTFS